MLPAFHVKISRTCQTAHQISYNLIW